MKFSLTIHEGQAVVKLDAETESEKQLFGLIGDYEVGEMTRVRDDGYNAYQRPPVGLKVILRKPAPKPLEPFTHPLQELGGK